MFDPCFARLGRTWCILRIASGKRAKADHFRIALPHQISPRRFLSDRILSVRAPSFGNAKSDSISRSIRRRNRTLAIHARSRAAKLSLLISSRSCRHALAFRFGGTGTCVPRYRHVSPQTAHGTGAECCVGRRVALRQSKQTQLALPIVIRSIRRPRIITEVFGTSETLMLRSTSVSLVRVRTLPGHRLHGRPE